MLCGDHHLAEDLTQTTTPRSTSAGRTSAHGEPAGLHPPRAHAHVPVPPAAAPVVRAAGRQMPERVLDPRPSLGWTSGGTPPAAPPPAVCPPTGRTSRPTHPDCRNPQDACRRPLPRLPPGVSCPPSTPTSRPPAKNSAMTHLREEMYDAYASMHVDLERLVTQAQAEGGRVRRRNLSSPLLRPRSSYWPPWPGHLGGDGPTGRGGRGARCRAGPGSRPRRPPWRGWTHWRRPWPRGAGWDRLGQGEAEHLT